MKRRIFLDTSVLIAASGSVSGASRCLIAKREQFKLELYSSFYCLGEVERNIDKLANAREAWVNEVYPCLTIVADAYSSRFPVTFSVSKDRPVLLSALAEQVEILLTLDRHDFVEVLGKTVYGMLICTPADLLRTLRPTALA